MSLSLMMIIMMVVLNDVPYLQSKCRFSFASRAWKFQGKRAFQDWPACAGKYPELLEVVKRMEDNPEDEPDNVDDLAEAWVETSWFAWFPFVKALDL